MGKKRWNKFHRHPLIGTNFITNFSKYNNNIHLYIKARHEVINSWQCVNKVKSVLSCTHSLTDVNLTTEWKPLRTRWTDLDPVENRYLAAGSCDSNLYLYDCSKSWITKKFTYVGIFNPIYPNSSTGQVTCVQWYPFDAGLIISSSSQDYNIRIWDPNILTMVDEVKLFVSINHHHLSPVASNHSLIAAALISGEVALCDLRIGSAAHRLRRHKSCTFVQWSKHDQNILASGGIDDLICIWDVRSSKACLKAFNEDRLGTGKAQISSLAYTYDGLWLISLSSNSKSVTFWNSKTYSKRNINIKISEQSPSYRLRIDFTRNYYPDILYVPAKSQILAYDMSTGSLINTLHCPDSDLYGVVYNPSNNDIYGFGAKKHCLVFSPRLLQERQQEEREEIHHLKGQNLSQNDQRNANTTTDQIRNIYEDNWSSGSDEN